MLDYKREYERWLASDALNADEKAELQAIAGDEKEIESRFYGPLEFGTAGLRGTMKVGLHQMNVHVIRWATQGFADVIAAEGDEAKQKGVAICMDCRVNSMAFARAAAEVCAANGIRVRIFESLRPTPELSFAVREYGCQAGINVTASHNPKEYNGYKVYWEDGAQLPPHHASAIAAKMEDYIKKYHGALDGRILVDYNIHAEYTSNEQTCRDIAEVAKAAGLRMHLHLSETKSEHEECKQRHGGMTPLAYFESIAQWQKSAVHRADDRQLQ